MRHFSFPTSPDDFICPNPNCCEHWDHDEKGNLLSSFTNSGTWEHLSDSTNCPQCDDLEIDWRWVRNRELS